MHDGMNAAGPSSTPFTQSQERNVVLLLCLLAAVHVFIFSAAFPFFSIVDEDAHFDLVVKYSHGHIPGGADLVSLESAQYIARYGSWEPLFGPDHFPGGRSPAPKWIQPANEEWQESSSSEVRALMGRNIENLQPPLYYGLAGAWWHLGKIGGLNGGNLLYWIRFFNMLLAGVLVWLGNVTARTIFPENYFLRLGVPALLAFIPQTTFYSIENDVLSPLCFGAAFFLLVRMLCADVPDARLGSMTGLMLAATYLVKISNLPLLAVAAMILLIKNFHLAQAGKFRQSLPALALLVLSAGLPISAWRIWSKFNFGDATGSSLKMQTVGWTYKPVGEWLNHPIFSLQGFWTFFSKLMATFWQGEFLWHLQPLASPVVDLIYFILSVSFIGMAICALLSNITPLSKLQRQALWFGFWCFVSVVAFQGFLSLIYDFHDCFYPSRKYPYFTSGRLMLGALIPFMLLYLYGIDCALGWIKNNWIRPLVLIAMILFMLISEITVDWPVFSSKYNWFHM
jgi:hypothetical protein